MIYFVVVFMLVAGVFAAAQARRLWNDPQQVDLALLSMSVMPGSANAQRGMVRSVGVIAAFATVFGATIGIALLWTSHEAEIALVGVITAMSLLLLQVTIILFNRPRFLVPPHMRDEKGILW